MTKNQKGAQALVAFAVLCTVAAQTAHAENKLFATDVLDRGQFDINVNQGLFESKIDAHKNDFTQSSSFTANGSSSTISARAGVGAQTHVGAALGYAVIRARTHDDLQGPSVPDDHAKAKGFQGWSLWVKHGFLTSTSSPLSLAANLQIDLGTDRNIGAKVTNMARASVTAGWDFGTGVKGFADVTQKVAQHGKAGHSTELMAGAWVPVGRSVTMEPSVSFTRMAPHEYTPSVNRYGLALQGWLQITDNTYVRSSLTMYTSDGYNTTDGLLHVGTSTDKSLSLGLYHLF